MYLLLWQKYLSDLLEGINRRTLLEAAREFGIKVQEREIDLTELYVADEAFACGTSVFVAPIKEVDARQVGGVVIRVPQLQSSA